MTKNRPERLHGPGDDEDKGVSEKLGGRWCVSFSDDASTGTADVNDHDVCGVRGADTFWISDFTDVERIAQLQTADVHVDNFWEVVRKTGDFQRVDVLFNDTADFHARCFTNQVSRNVGGDFGFVVDREEVRMHGDTGEWVVLNSLEEREASAFAFDFKVHNDVFRAAVRDQIDESFSIHLEIPVFGAASVNDGWEPAFAAHLVEATGTCAVARCCFEGGLAGHVLKKRCGLMIRLTLVGQCCGGSFLAGACGLVKKLF